MECKMFGLKERKHSLQNSFWKIIEVLKKGHQIGLTQIAFSKTFDTINHRLLVNKF